MATKKRLLMIDDDPDFVEVVEKILVDAGYEVDAKYNPNPINANNRKYANRRKKPLRERKFKIKELANNLR